MGESNGDTVQVDEPFEDDDIEILEGDVVRTVIDGMISIQFSERVHSLVEKSFDRTIVLKLLGRRIGYATLKNKVIDLWKPKAGFKLMDTENDYFLVSFRSHEDYRTVLADGPWTIFCHGRLNSRCYNLSHLIWSRLSLCALRNRRLPPLVHGCLLRSDSAVLPAYRNLLPLDVLRSNLWGLASTPFQRCVRMLWILGRIMILVARVGLWKLLLYLGNKVYLLQKLGNIVRYLFVSL
ncbi:hypothetical protein V6N12_035318 [Hibiscus sabdariffa]|uniref:DUF4283 domain-containing protein n=1 Tax=Hibiscus sabdariffa TaxID=183260 RepID=A0ABR2BTL6_9ROSI